jgi:hypothetical protein
MTLRWRPVWLRLLRRRKSGGAAVSTSTARAVVALRLSMSVASQTTSIRKAVHAGGCRQAANRVARHWQKMIGSG